MTDQTPSPETSSGPDGHSPADERATWRAVAVPTEHGGWGLTLEPVVLGLVVAWSSPGLALGAAAVIAFVSRTPLKVVMVDRYRRRSLTRTKLATRVVAVEAAVALVLVLYVASAAPASTWIPLLIAAPLVIVELWYDMRSRSRRLVPELAGAIGMGSVAAAIALAGSESTAIALGLWCVLAARAVGSITFVRYQLRRAKHHRGRAAPVAAGQIGAVGLAITGTLLGWVPALGVVAIAVLTGFHLVEMRRPPRRVVVIGVQQTVLGFVVVMLTAVGVYVD